MSAPPPSAVIVISREMDRALACSGSGPGEKQRACSFFCDQMGYLLHMSWLGRPDKMEPGVVPALDWTIRTGLPLSDVDYPVFAPSATGFKGSDHEALAKKATHAVFLKMRVPDRLPEPATLFQRLRVPTSFEI